MIPIKQSKFPELYRALKLLYKNKNTFQTIKHFETWLSKVDNVLGQFRIQNKEAYTEFITGNNWQRIVFMRDKMRSNLGGVHQVLEWFADHEDYQNP